MQGQYSVKEIYIDGNKYGDCDTVLKEGCNEVKRYCKYSSYT